MGSGASCAERPSTPLDERLRTMLIMRAYNCRPRDWTMKDQFDAVAENGFLTKDNLRLALRLAECPRIEALLDRCNLFDHPAGSAEENTDRDTSTSSAASVTSISVADLIAFVENSARHRQNGCPSQQERWNRFTSSGGGVGNPSPQQSSTLAPPSSPSSTLQTPDGTLSSSKRPGNLDHVKKHSSSATSGSSTSFAQPTTRSGPVPPQQLPSPAGANSCPALINTAGLEPAKPSLDSNGVDTQLLSPRVVPLTSKWALSPSAAAEAAALAGPKRLHHGTATDTSTPVVRGEGKEDTYGHNSVSGRRSEERMGQEGAAGKVFGGEEEEEASKRGGGGHCTTLVRHLGAVLGLRGKDAYRRPAPRQPVWRKRETLIQERIVQYTTLDEEGTVQELFETEKSQTEVLHMECKRTGEFAHSESTHYEGGEAFNGEVVLEETGVERYVHLRSVDDEYEHLESTLPTRARSGGAGAAGGVGGNPHAEGVERGPGDNEHIGDVDTVVDGGDNDERSAEGAALSEGTSYRGEPDGRNSGTHSENPRHPRPERQTSSWPAVPPEQRIKFPYQDDDVEPNAALPRRDAAHGSGPVDPSFMEIPPDETAHGGTDDRRHPSPPPSAYHYRSPSCSPRLSPRPMRSPYRQEGVGGRESSGRGEGTRRSAENGERREESADPACSPGGGGGDAARRGRHAEGSARVVGEGKHGDVAGDSDDARTDGREEKEGAGGLRPSTGVPCSPLLGPVPNRGDGGNEGASAQGSGGDDDRPDACFITEGLNKPSATRVDEFEGACVGGRGGGLGGDGLEGAGLGDSGGFGEGYEGSVVFIDNQGHEGGGGQYSRSAHAEEGWWQPESESVLRGVDFAFEKEDNVPVPAVNTAGEEVDVFLSRAQQPTTSAMPTSSPTTRSIGDDADHQVGVSGLVDGLRSGAHPPTVLNPRDHAGNSVDREATLDRKSDVSRCADSSRDQEPAAPAPFHSHVWGSKATVAVPCEDGEEEKLARTGVAATAGNLDYSSGLDVAA